MRSTSLPLNYLLHESAVRKKHFFKFSYLQNHDTESYIYIGNNDKCVGIEVQHNEFLLEKKKYITKLEVLESLLVTVHSNLKHISCLQTSCFLYMHADTLTDFPLNSRNLTLQLTVFVNKKNPPVDPTVLKRCLSILEAVCTNRLVALLLKISVLLKKM